MFSSEHMTIPISLNACCEYVVHDAKIYRFISLKSHIKIKIKCYAIKVTQEG